MHQYQPDMSDLTFRFYRVDQAKEPELKAWLVKEWNPDEYVTEELVGGYPFIRTERNWRAIEREHIAEAIIGIDPSAAFLVFQDPIYEGDNEVAPGYIVMHHPDLGTFTGTCDEGGNVLSGGDSVPWDDAFRQLVTEWQAATDGRR